MTVSSWTDDKATVERDGTSWVKIRFTSAAVVSMSMEDLRDMCNDIAAVLDDWFEERDRNGRS